MECSFKSGVCGIVLLLVAGLSGCSTVSSVAEKSGAVLSNLNPFSSSPPNTEANQAEPASVAVPATPAAADSIRVDATPANGNGVTQAAARQPASGQVQAMVADNKECTTFCSLPLHKSQ